MPENIRRASFKIVIKRVEKPFSHDPFAELDWICQSFGFFEPIARGKTASSVFKEVVKGSEAQKPLTSTFLAKRLEMSRGSIINHLNNLQRSGLIVRQGRSYFPRSSSMLRTIEEIEEDIERIFQKMKKTAQELDRELGFEGEQKE
ncbi:MAG: helix-turn-helix domain-containing protein [archaeon]|nr:helix-turn-helix domain-containing protein [archaeon]